MKSVLDMTAAELLEEQARRDANRRAGRPLDYVPPEVIVQHAADQLKRADVLEKAEQLVITKMARAIGCTVRSTSQARASKVAPGIPDLWISHRARCFAGWFEVKRQAGGRTSSEQLDFGEECRAAGVAYGRGDRYDFHRWLTDSGFPAPPIPKD